MPVVISKLATRNNLINKPERFIKNMNLKEFYNKRNKILIFRGVGGLGDILMHRMIFEDIKRLIPDAEIHFACPKYYHDAVSDHPFIDELLDSNKVDRQEYIACFNTTTACGRTEMKLAPFAGPHRSDIWASHCGLILTNHEMHFVISSEEKTNGKNIIESHRDRNGPIVIVSSVSAMQNKNLTEAQTVKLINGLRDRGLCPIGIHNNPIWEYVKNDFPVISLNKIREWISVIDQSDYVVSVDSAAFHCSGGLKKPMVGIFSFTNSESYGKYYHTAELIQGPCPYGNKGCYNWITCPYQNNPKPCLIDIDPEIILSSVDNMLKKYPKGDSI